MMFYAEELRVVLATIHVPLADVPRLLTRELVDAIIDLTAMEMRGSISASAPRVAGLNPHAGEHGVIGSETR